MKTKTVLAIIIVGLISLSATFNPHSSNRYYEAPVVVEEWMTKPFNTDLEEDIEIEEWMTKPF